MSRKNPAAPAPDISPVLGRDGAVEGTRRRFFAINGIAITVEADSADRETAAAALASQLHAICSIPPAPPRIEAWGPGQFDRVTLGPGVEAWLRITPEGRVRMVIPGGDLDVTAGAVSLGTGLHEAGSRAAQIRVRLMERATSRAERLGHDPVWGYSAVACRRCSAVGEFGADGKTRGAVVTERCEGWPAGATAPEAA